MGKRIQVGVVGSAVFAPRHPERTSLEEALRDAGIHIEDIDGIDGIVVTANGQLDGRAISIMMASGSVGGVDLDILSTPGAAEHAFVLGALRVRSGIYRTNRGQT